MESINDNNYNYNKYFFIDGPGGNGKSYLLISLKWCEIPTYFSNMDISWKYQ